MYRQFILIILCFGMVMDVTAQATPESESDFMADQRVFYTYHQESGNRFVHGTGTFPIVTTTDYPFDAQPQWLVAAHQDTSLLTSTQLLTVQLADDRIISIDPLTGEINAEFGIHSADQPIVAYHWRGQWAWLGQQNDNPTNPIFLYDRGAVIAVDDSGDLQLSPLSEQSLVVNIQADAKIVRSNDDRFAVYANATNQRYVHGIMGDDIEGASLVIFQIVDDALQIIQQIDLEGDAVYEGLSPMWADIDGDGIQDLITTVSDSRVGSRIRIYRFTNDGMITIEGQAIGQPNRWQHQLAWGTFGVDGAMQLVEVLTPHIGGIVRFYEFDGASLSIVAQLGGYTSHIIGSRNLDMAVAGDFDGDGQPEIVLPSQDRTRIAGIANTANGAQVMWELPIDGVLSTNLAATRTPQGLMLAVGRTDGTVRVWSPQG